MKINNHCGVGGAFGHHREREGEDPGQGGNPPGSAEADLRR